MNLTEKMAVIGYAMYYKGYSKEKIDKLNGKQILELRNKFEEWILGEKKEILI